MSEFVGLVTLYLSANLTRPTGTMNRSEGSQQMQPALYSLILDSESASISGRPPTSNSHGDYPNLPGATTVFPWKTG